METEVERAAGRRRVAGEAVEDAPHVAPPLGADGRERIVVRLARMDHDGPADLPREGDLAPEHLDLHGPRGEIVVVVEPDLADGADAGEALERRADRADSRFGRVLERRGLMRVHAGRETDGRPRLGHPLGALRLLVVRHVENAQRPLDAGRKRPADHGLEVVREDGVGEVAVRVGQHHSDGAAPRTPG